MISGYGARLLYDDADRADPAGQGGPADVEEVGLSRNTPKRKAPTLSVEA